MSLAFDPENVLALLGQNHPLARTIVLSAVEDLAQQIDRLAAARAGGDRETARRALHTIKGLGMQAGATALHRGAAAAYDAVRRSEREISNDDLAALRHDYEAFAQAARAWAAR